MIRIGRSLLRPWYSALLFRPRYTESTESNGDRCLQIMPNHLAQSQSLYLRKHAENLINWWYWCDEALSIAKAENKPIFLSIGYSSCHWCTVMEGEAFSDQAIADYINQFFLPIKLDREERPDLDSIYMQSLQMMTSQGGWPLNIFLTPDDLVPFYGGTYFPVEPKFNRPGFLQVLQSIRKFYDSDKAKLDAFKQDLLEALHKSTVFSVSQSNNLTQALLNRGIDTSASIITPSDTFIGNPSFPMIPYASLVLQGTRLKFEALQNVKRAAEKRGEDLALGGIYDHVAGGFHRYTVDSTWTVPHFEKMLYDNGQIVEYLANLWSAGHQKPAFQRAITGTVNWLKREMVAAEGYFYAAQDADNFADPQDKEPEEGQFYVWKYEDLVKILTPNELKAFQEAFTVSERGNFEGSNVLQRKSSEELSATVDMALGKLFQIRYGSAMNELSTFAPAKSNEEAKRNDWPGRIPPVTDTKMIVAWNSLMISGLARAFAVFSQQEAWQLATQAANFILENQWVDSRLHRLNYAGETAVLAQAEDYALLIKALLDLQAAAPTENKWLEKAIETQAEFDEYFWSIELAGYFNNAVDNSEDLLVRERSYLDNATPAANGVAIANLVRLANLTDNLDYLQRAEQVLNAFSSILENSAQACPSLMASLDWFLNSRSVKTTSEALPQLLLQYYPTTTIRIDGELPSGAVGLVCQGTACMTPAQTIEELQEQIRTIG